MPFLLARKDLDARERLLLHVKIDLCTQLQSTPTTGETFPLYGPKAVVHSAVCARRKML